MLLPNTYGQQPSGSRGQSNNFEKKSFFLFYQFTRLIYIAYLLSQSDFSSIGPTYDGRIKPDLLATGEYLVSASRFCNGSARTDLQIMQGTSMATPNVAGHLRWCIDVVSDAIARSMTSAQFLFGNI